MSLITAADAIAALNAAGHRAMKSPARSRVGCQTLCYLVDGQYVNLGRLRQLAREVLSPKAANLGRSLGLSARGKVRAQAAPIVAAIAAAPKPVRLNATTEPTTATIRAAVAAGQPVSLAAVAVAHAADRAKSAALSALEALAAGGPLDCATWQALGWPFEGFLAWAQDRDADRRLNLMRQTIRERGTAACLDLL